MINFCTSWKKSERFSKFFIFELIVKYFYRCISYWVFFSLHNKRTSCDVKSKYWKIGFFSRRQSRFIFFCVNNECLFCLHVLQIVAMVMPVHIHSLWLIISMFEIFLNKVNSDVHFACFCLFVIWIKNHQ